MNVVQLILVLMEISLLGSGRDVHMLVSFSDYVVEGRHKYG